MAETVVYHLSCYNIITARNVKNQHEGEKVKETDTAHTKDPATL